MQLDSCKYSQNGESLRAIASLAHSLEIESREASHWTAHRKVFTV